MIIDLQARHIFKAHKQEFEIGYVFFRVLDENERVIRVLEMGDPTRDQMGNHTL
jgi:hypothetical protein